MRLSEIPVGQSATVVKVLGYGAFRHRIIEMGFVGGKQVDVLMSTPLGDPIVYNIMGYEVSLRRSEAELIEVSLEEVANSAESQVSLEANEQINHTSAHTNRKTINIALVGNPNCGKTSLFNRASGSREHVGNYSGVTVDAKRGEFHYDGYTFVVYDLPGTYALTAYTPEELYVRKHIAEQKPDVIVNVVASSNLERNLYLTTEIIDMDYPSVVALNMYDELTHSGAELNYELLGGMLGVPMVPLNSRGGEGFEDLYSTIIEVYEGRNSTVRHIHINHAPTLENAINPLKEELKKDKDLTTYFSARFVAIKMLTGDNEIEKLVRKYPDYAHWSKLRDRIVKDTEATLGENIDGAIVSHKYGFISGALAETYTAGKNERNEKSRAIDSVITNKFLGIPIFLGIMWLMFETTFTLGAFPMEWIESGVGAISEFVSGVMSDGMLKDLIVDGIIGGVGGVIVFLPNIVILYLFISFMEDSGYMARAALIMDRVMHSMGLHGKSFIPMLMGFGCNVPAIISTRTIESRSSRLITILINPFISCSARLPVYLLFVGAFFSEYAGTVLFMIYLFGIIMAVVTAKLLRKLLFGKDETPFVMELPPYRVPTLRSALLHMWEKSYQYLKKMGGIILVASIAIWFLSYFPRGEEQGSVQQQQNSYLGVIGSAISPVMEPLGFDWRANIAIMSSMAAKEVAVSTLGVLYEGDSESGVDLGDKLKSVDPQSGKPSFTPITAMSFMVFVLLCFPCIASLVAIGSESGSWKWVLAVILYNTSLAWIAAWAVKQIGELII